MTKGETYAKSVRDGYSLNESQDVLVSHIASTMDLIDNLPATDVVELRQQRLLLSRLLGQLALPEADAEVFNQRKSERSQQTSRAARIRWGTERVNNA